jgi:putative transposase
MGNKRTYRTKELKFKVALEAVREQKQVSQIAAEYGVSATQVNTWKRQLLEQGPQVFSRKSDNKEQSLIEEQQELYRKVGEQAVQIDWLKKTLGIDQ